MASVPLPAVGTPLPGTPKSSVAVTLEYGHVALAGGELRLAASAHYQSSIIPALSATIPKVGGYTTVDARLSFDRSHWMGTVYVNNLTNQLGINSYSDPFNYGTNYQAVVSTPRTVGVTLGYSLKER
jgi:outer membrane receptor protein involved in Fe transport